jgi:hypothetical protein
LSGLVSMLGNASPLLRCALLLSLGVTVRYEQRKRL